MFCAFSDTHEIQRGQLTAPACGYPMIGAAVTTLEPKNSTRRGVLAVSHSGLNALPGALVVEAAGAGGREGPQGGRYGWPRPSIGPARGAVGLEPVRLIFIRGTHPGTLSDSVPDRCEKPAV